MLKQFFIGSSLALTLPLAASADIFNTYWKTENIEMSVPGIGGILSKSSGGDIEILGRKNTDKIHVVARFGGEKLDPDDYILKLELVGDKAVFTSKIMADYGNDSHIDLEVIIPDSMKLTVNNGSGDLSIENIGDNTSITDTSGDIQVDRIKGNLEINDNSGDIDIKNVSGFVRLNDRSGDIDVHTVDQDVTIEDNSGDIWIQYAGANVDIEDSSGDIQVEKTSGSVTVTDSQGDVDIDGADSFTITKHGRGDVNTRGIRNETKSLL